MEVICFNKEIRFPFYTFESEQRNTQLFDVINVIEKPYLYELETMIKSKTVNMSGRSVCYHIPTLFWEGDPSLGWALEIKDVLTLLWNQKLNNIYFTKDKEYTDERLLFWVLHTFLPIHLELERIYRILHVGSVEIAGSAVLFLAPSFGGKSTMVDYFLKQGHSLLSDDSLGIDKREDGYYAVPSYPFHRPFRKPETLGEFTKHFLIEKKLIQIVYVLNKCDPATTVEIVELKGIEKFKAFHYSAFIDLTFMKRERFEYFTDMAKHISVYRVTYPHDKRKLPDVYREIVAHYNQSVNF